MYEQSETGVTTVVEFHGPDDERVLGKFNIPIDYRPGKVVRLKKFKAPSGQSYIIIENRADNVVLVQETVT